MAVRRRATIDPLFPSWRDLLLRAASRLRLEKKELHANVVSSLIEMGNPDDYLEAARRAVNGLGPNWYDFLRDQLDHPIRLARGGPCFI